MEANAVIEVDGQEEKKPNGSRFNALKHGLTAKTAVLPGEDPEMFQARIDQYKGDVETRNGIEEDLAKNAALASWQVDRAANLRAARAKSAVAKATKSDADQLREDVEAAMLGNRLFHDRMGPIELYATQDYLLEQKRTSWDHENPDDPDHPAILVRRLCETVAGCRWLLKSWSELRDILKLGLGLQSHEKLKMLRLMGRQPINALGRPEVARVFLACHVLEPQFDYAFQELRSEMHVERFARFKELMERWAQIGIAPPNRMAARVVLMGIIDEAIEGLRGLEAQLQEKEDEAQREREACPSDEDQKAGQQVERHQGSCNRLIFGNLNAIHKLRRNEADGWGKARQQREQKAQGKKKSTPVDHRSVVDERGVVRPAFGYDGDLEEGLARFEAEFGRTGLNKPWEEFEATHRRAVPDYARWKPTARAEPSLGQERGSAGALTFLEDDGGSAGASHSLQEDGGSAGALHSLEEDGGSAGASASLEEDGGSAGALASLEEDGGSAGASSSLEEDGGSAGASHSPQEDGGSAGASHSLEEDGGSAGASHSLQEDGCSAGASHSLEEDGGSAGASSSLEDDGGSAGASHSRQDGGGRMELGTQAEAFSQGESQGIEPVRSVTQVLVETVRESNLQNEICHGPRLVVSGDLSDGDRAGGAGGAAAEGNGMANGTRSVPATGNEDVGAAAGGDKRADGEVEFRSMAADETLEVVAEGNGMANGTRSVPATGNEDFGAAAGGDKRADGEVEFRSMAADETLEVVAEGNGMANGTRSVPATGSGDCGAAAEGDGVANGTRSAPAAGNEDVGAPAGVMKAGDGVKSSCTRPAQSEFLFGKRARDFAGASFAIGFEGVSRKRRREGRYLKRDAKRWRKVMAKLEVIRRTGRASEAEIAALKQSVEEPHSWHPNSLDTHHKHVARSP